MQAEEVVLKPDETKDERIKNKHKSRVQKGLPIFLGDVELKLEDPKSIEKLAAVGVSKEIIADLFTVSFDWLRRRLNENDPKCEPLLAQAYKRGRARLKSNLLTAQHKAATRGNVVMMIWLGKQYLQQRDKMDHTVDGEIKGEIRGIEDFVRFLKEAKDELRAGRLAAREPKVIEGKVVDDDDDDADAAQALSARQDSDGGGEKGG